MIIQDEAIWVPCSKEEFDDAWKDDPFFAPYRAVPIYNGVHGIFDYKKKPDGYRYEKRVGSKRVILINSAEANDKELMSFLNSLCQNKE